MAKTVKEPVVPARVYVTRDDVKPDAIAKQIQHAQGLLRAGETFKASQYLEPILSRYPNHVELLYCQAVALRMLNQLDDAYETLAKLLGLAPRFGKAHQEHGHLLVAQGKNEQATAAYQRAVQHNPALLASWQRIDATISEKHEYSTDYRDHVRRQIAYLLQLPRELRTVVSLRHEKRDFRAERICRGFLQSNPKHVEGIRQLALIAQDRGMLDDAEFLIESAIEFEPDNVSALISYVDILHRRQKFDKSLAITERLLTRDPGNLLFRLAHAHQLVAVGRFDEALSVYDEILTNHGNARLASPRLYLSRGHALKTFGRTEEAIQSYRDAYGLQDSFGDAYWSLANLKTYEFTDRENKQMLALVERADMDKDDLAHIHFALGKALEDSKDFEESFKHYERGNAIRKKQTGYDSAVMTGRLRLQRWVCNREFFETREKVGCDALDPIFIVGLPRAGSTLLEQILASHPDVDGTLELHHISTFAQKLDGRRRRKDDPRYPGTLGHLKSETFRAMGEQFLSETRVHRGQASRFIDKMPNNFRHIGMIHLILPKAKIIDARRHPMASCFSAYKQLFASGQEFTYNLQDIGTYYQDYVELMKHWGDVLPNKVLRVQYENVIDDLESQVRRILDFCELPFDSACLNFHESDRAVRTPSAEQVRQPIYREGLEQWRNYETWLTPLKEALGPALWSYQ